MTNLPTNIVKYPASLPLPNSKYSITLDVPIDVAETYGYSKSVTITSDQTAAKFNLQFDYTCGQYKEFLRFYKNDIKYGLIPFEIPLKYGVNLNNTLVHLDSDPSYVVTKNKTTVNITCINYEPSLISLKTYWREKDIPAEDAIAIKDLEDIINNTLPLIKYTAISIDRICAIMENKSADDYIVEKCNTI